LPGFDRELALLAPSGKPAIKQNDPETMRRYLKCEQVAEMLQLSPKTIYNMVYQGRIPCIRLSNKCVRFDLIELEKAVKLAKAELAKQNAGGSTDADE
jgi:excisionase family DNA binding protein